MANNNEITREDILALVDVKTKATNISYSDIFKTIDNIKPDNTKEFWQYFLLPLLFFVAAIVVMLFISPNSSWHRFSIIVYVLSSYPYFSHKLTLEEIQKIEKLQIEYDEMKNKIIEIEKKFNEIKNKLEEKEK